MPYKGVPNIRKRLIGLRLRRLREAKGMSVEEAAAIMGISAPAVRRHETGITYTSVADIHLYAKAYGLADEALLERLLLLSRHGRQRGWWVQFSGGAGPDATDLADIEDIATVMHIVQAHVVPTLLQTPDYTRCIVGSARRFHRLHGWDTEELINFRERRKRIMERPVPPTLHVVIAEQAIRDALPLNPEVMRGQVEHLLTASEWDHVSLRVLPVTEMSVFGESFPTVLLGFDGTGEPHVGFFEGGQGAAFVETPEQLAYHGARFMLVQSESLSVEETRRYLRSVLSDM